jgi:hypothetical protein
MKYPPEGALAAVTVTVVDAEALPPAPVHVSVYVTVPAVLGVRVLEPLAGMTPDQAPDPVHGVAPLVFVLDHVSVTN